MTLELRRIKRCEIAVVELEAAAQRRRETRPKLIQELKNLTGKHSSEIPLRPPYYSATEVERISSLRGTLQQSA